MHSGTEIHCDKGNLQLHPLFAFFTLRQLLPTAAVAAEINVHTLAEKVILSMFDSKV